MITKQREKFFCSKSPGCGEGPYWIWGTRVGSQEVWKNLLEEAVLHPASLEPWRMRRGALKKRSGEGSGYLVSWKWEGIVRSRKWHFSRAKSWGVKRERWVLRRGSLRWCSTVLSSVVASGHWQLLDTENMVSVTEELNFRLYLKVKKWKQHKHMKYNCSFGGPHFTFQTPLKI